MGSIRKRSGSGFLFIDFRWNGKRCREISDLNDTKTNRKKLKRKLDQIEREMKVGTFCYEHHFPLVSQVSENKPKVSVEPINLTGLLKVATSDRDLDSKTSHEDASPEFSQFLEEWLQENRVTWRRSHLVNMESMVNKYYLPAFGRMKVGSITRADLLKFRSTLAKVPGRNGNNTISNNRINKIMDPLRRILEEAADRYEFNTPFSRIKPLRMQRTDVRPFTLEEVRLILDNVRKDYQHYYAVRFYTGMRTGEVDGLLWKYVDFENKIILVRETLVDGVQEYTKTDYSQREIYMSQPVFNALKGQYEATGKSSKFVFCNVHGNPLDHNNVTKRVWYPLLAALKLEKRRPYQSRHTAATLWLAAGEAPEWIARQMGHANTEMLFKVYSRFVPNLTRQDGSAFEQLLSKSNANKGGEL